MATPREVLTFQLGNYANYVGTHWWNIQESYFSYDEKNPSEICHDVLFREGKTFKGVPTFTPRAIVVDQKENAIHTPILDDSLGTSRKNTTIVWDPEKIASEHVTIPEKHEYIADLERIDKGQRVPKKDYNFEETVRTWCDYMRTRYHPRSMALLNNELKTDIFHSGTEMYDSIGESLTEKVRTYLEECDNLQGFQVLVDVVDAYGGVGNNVMMHLRDEYPNKTIFALPLIPSYYTSTTPVGDVHKMINILMSYQKFSEHCDLVVPLSTNRTGWRGLGAPINFPHLNYDPKLFYHSSSILASYLDTVTLKYRLKSDFGTLSDVASGLNFWNRKICAAGMSLPFPMSTNSYLLDTLEQYDDSMPLWNCLTPSCTIGQERIFYQRITIRGVTTERLRDPSVKRTNSQAYTCTSVPELLHLYLSFYLNTISNVTSARTPLKTDVPFPRIFSSRVTRIGSVDESPSTTDDTVLSCPVLAGLHSCKDIGRMLESLHVSVRGINIRRFHQFVGVGMDIDEYKECLEKVMLLGNDYGSDVEP